MLAALVVCLVTAGKARAQEEGEEEEGTTLSDGIRKARVPTQDVVQAKFFEKKGRIELFPHLYGSVLNNQFANRFLVLSGGGVAWHLRESFFLEGVVEYFPDYPGYDDLKSLSRLLALQVDIGDEIPTVPKESLYLGAAVGFSPIYGKINLVSSYVQSFDISFTLGAGMLQVYHDRYQVQDYDQDTGAALLNGPLEPREAKWFVSPNIGLATRFFLTRWMTLRADIRMYGYVEKVTDYANPYVDATGATAYPFKNAFRDSFILTTGVSFFLPPR
jgi:outer membrane beta-barrel protein